MWACFSTVGAGRTICHHSGLTLSCLVVEPVIETSTHLRFVCFPLTYFSLQQQFPLTDVRGVDFTPGHGGWTPLLTHPRDSPLAEMMPEKENNGARSLCKLSSWTAEELGLSVDPPQLVVPITNGFCARKEDTSTVFDCFAVVNFAWMW
ncbi:hypothetical protein PF005_g21236 [Phytophthora fragariae]|uniref:Uncharacterized protein n=1 Tax=Phytophthora fragariae TaxID=53985 RepID=A0A6A4CFY5_9STRA|nr:hypothetical protein PF003_g10346 [Phytophthora fragariae]KAE9000883.1 hypothetical protein PF011_g13991 [Phytophthora fragariae]KAE9138260.1 hypothetical protein PF006_g13994 [Phytophthora fragariae]KAE9185490.1 hypothetical protein PF005_g21236 [Phytophthora fragariae]KAE9197940.1 hypothetical protein PF004_g19691 [Phytophthora fragariae]